MLQTVTVPNPAAGADWSVTVPGAYTWKVLGVRATLAAAATPPVSAPDSSGNAHTLGYNATMYPNETFGVAGPFGGGGGAAVDCRNYDSLGGNWLGSAPNAGGLFDVATFSWEALVNCQNSGNVIQTVAAIDNAGGPTLFRCGIMVDRGGSGVRGLASTFDQPALGVGLALNTWGQIGCTYDGAQWIGYANGVAGAPVAGHAPTLGLVNQPLWVMGDGASSQGTNGLVAAVAYYSGVLSAARFLAHYNAVAVSAAAYSAAVLADSPLAFWMLSQTATQQSRAAMLDVTDGTTLVMEIPPGLPQANATTRTYSWVPPVASASAGVNDATQIIPLPPITLRPGYTIGTRTPDKLSGDQWSAITVYVDQQASSDPPAGGDPLAFRSLLLLG